MLPETSHEIVQELTQQHNITSSCDLWGESECILLELAPPTSCKLAALIPGGGLCMCSITPSKAGSR